MSNKQEQSVTCTIDDEHHVNELESSFSEWYMAGQSDQCHCTEIQKHAKPLMDSIRAQRQEIVAHKLELESREKQIAIEESKQTVHAQGMQVATERVQKLEQELKLKEIQYDERMKLLDIRENELKQQQLQIIADNDIIIRENAKLQTTKEQIENDRNDIINDRAQLRLSNQELDSRFAEISRRTAELDGLEQKALFLEEQRKAFECTKQDSLVYAQNMRELADERQKNAQMKFESLTAKVELEFAITRAQLETDRVKLNTEQQKCIDDNKKKDNEVKKMKEQLDKITTEVKTSQEQITKLNDEIKIKSAALDAKQQELDIKQKELDAKNAPPPAAETTPPPATETPPPAA